MRDTRPGDRADDAEGTMGDYAQEDARTGQAREELPSSIAWVVVYILNLIFPLSMGLSVAEGNGKIGMFLAILVLLGLGCRVCLASRRSGFALIIGGGLVALSQVVPVLQVSAGVLGLIAAQCVMQVMPQVNGDQIRFDDRVLGGFVATFATGVILMTAALMLGMTIQWFNQLFSLPEPSTRQDFDL